MSSLSGSIADDEPPPWKKFQPLSSPTLFSSLPLDMVLNIVARVPKRYYPILACVSKNLRDLVRSPEIQKTRSLLGKDSLYISFVDLEYRPIYEYWYTLRRIENNTTEKNLFTSIGFEYPPEPYNSTSFIVVGSEIFFIGGGSSTPSSSLWILDTRSGELRQGTSMQEEQLGSIVGLVGSKIYVIGGRGQGGNILAEVYDLKSQTWEAAPIPELGQSWYSFASVSLDRKLFTLSSYTGIMTCYETKDGSCKTSELPNDKWGQDTGVCVIDNVLYVYFFRFGLMWYDSQLMLWRVVYGLDLGKPQSVGMAEYYGKLAFIWEKPSLVRRKKKEIWCRMIGLVRGEEGIHGIAEPSQLLEIVPLDYQKYRCLSLSD